MSLPDYLGRPVLVLGASGFIGAWLARHLAAAGAELHVAVRDPGGVKHLLAAECPSMQVHILDACDEAAVRALVVDLAPQVTFNAVGYGVDRGERDDALAATLNGQLPGWLAAAVADLEECPWHGQRLVHLGSALEYGTATGELAEDGPHSPTTLYGQTKLEGTRTVGSAVAGGALKALTARLFTVYGPGEHGGRLLPSLLQARQSDEPIELTDGLQQRDFTYVEDVAQGVLRLAAVQARQPLPINLASGALHSVRDFVQQAAQALGIEAVRVRFGALPTRPEEMCHDPVTNVRLRNLLGWVPSLSIAEGVARTAAYVDRDAHAS